ncbi:GNAT family N-acetyltransferase [Pontimicrobium aquaticum]|uniref:GNAT family N-acetyltransferase n=1 Tax=Pontimicrobium aquaticum TaxID=2565367 RepID=A0A4U0EPK9_9FLAO|nr:GNAT family N-acetyltransferase [Pontimicrobium aquaticum]
MHFLKTDSNSISQLRTQLYKSFVAPLDSMWQDLYIASSQAYTIEKDSQNIGYCCVDDKSALLQLFLNSNNRHLMRVVVKNLIDLKLIISASLSSIEPVSFNACLFHSKSITTNTLCYEHSNKIINDKNMLHVELVTPEYSSAIRSYYKEHVGFDDTFGYVDNLVSRKELYMILENDTIVVTGECRLSDTQINFSDIGVAVNKDFRKQGLATRMLKELAKKAIEQNRNPICSTTIDNIGSQKAIEKAGFYCSNIIFDINFN